MNSEIIAVAFGAKCGLRACRLSGRFSPGLTGASASRLSRWSKWARANEPMPNADWLRDSRRVVMASVHVEEFGGSQQLLAHVRQRLQFCVGLPPASPP